MTNYLSQLLIWPLVSEGHACDEACSQGVPFDLCECGIPHTNTHTHELSYLCVIILRAIRIWKRQSRLTLISHACFCNVFVRFVCHLHPLSCFIPGDGLRLITLSNAQNVTQQVLVLCKASMTFCFLLVNSIEAVNVSRFQSHGHPMIAQELAPNTSCYCKGTAYWHTLYLLLSAQWAWTPKSPFSIEMHKSAGYAA